MPPLPPGACLFPLIPPPPHKHTKPPRGARSHLRLPATPARCARCGHWQRQPPRQIYAPRSGEGWESQVEVAAHQTAMETASNAF